MDSNEKKLEALTAQAITLATELSLALDKENGEDSNEARGRLRNLSILAFEAVSKIVVTLMRKEHCS